MKLLHRRLWLLVVALFLAVALPSDGRSVRADDLASGAPDVPTGVAPGAPKVLLIKQESSNWPEYSQQIEMVLRHFTPNTTTVSTEQYTDDQLLGFDRVVVLHNETTPLPTVLLEDLARADRPILWLGYGLNQLPVDTGTTFGFSLEDHKDEDLPNEVEYRGQRYPAKLIDYYPIRIEKPSAQVLATYTYSDGRTSIPYIVRGGNLWYVNGLPAPTGDYPDAESDAPFLVFADVLHEFFGTSITASRQAVIRLEDVSVHIPPARLTKIIDYLYSRRIPFTMGVIPAQRMEDGSIVELSDRPDFVKALRYAQDHGGTIILHGYNHTFGSGEDYEFWDEKRRAPIAGETWDMYAHKIEDGIRILRNNGIEPRLWETPHYAASPLAYRVFSDYFSHTIENRAPVPWLPYPAGPDQYGQMVIPETIGYVDPAAEKPVQRQLQRANTLRIVRDSWAVGFFHPASIELSKLKTLVEGLQRQGYTFADIQALPTEVRYDYHPDALTRLNTWLMVDLQLHLDALDYRLQSQYDWWPTVRVVPWLSILFVGSMIVFLIRLRKQWQPDTSNARSIVGSPGTLGSRRPLHLTRWGTMMLVGVMVLFSGILLFGGRHILLSEEWRGEWSGSERLHGWSNLDWTVAYDGYGEVGVEDVSASLRPATSERPLETHAALALAGGPNWRNYTFETRMNLQQQLRENSSPNEWEAGWLLFRYLDGARSYYLIHKTNGIELGKLVPPEGEGQIFLVTKPRPEVVPERWYDYRIEVRGANIKVYIDDELQINYTDPDPILRGGVGLYTEDAHVHFQQPSVTEIPSSR